jgi:hypothetical protein
MHLDCLALSKAYHQELEIAGVMEKELLHQEETAVEK